MRFMMLMIPLGYETAAPDVQLDPERVKAMTVSYTHLTLPTILLV